MKKYLLLFSSKAQLVIFRQGKLEITSISDIKLKTTISVVHFKLSNKTAKCDWYFLFKDNIYSYVLKIHFYLQWSNNPTKPELLTSLCFLVILEYWNVWYRAMWVTMYRWSSGYLMTRSRIRFMRITSVFHVLLFFCNESVDGWVYFLTFVPSKKCKP